MNGKNDDSPNETRWLLKKKKITVLQNKLNKLNRIGINYKEEKRMLMVKKFCSSSN